MIDTSAPNPFDIKAWKSNLIPIDDVDAVAWWMVALVALVHGEPAIDELAEKLARVAPIACA